MAAMDQSELTKMCNDIEAAANRYVTQTNADVEAVTNGFNQIWVSPKSKEKASELSSTLYQLAKGIQDTFTKKSQNISDAVKGFNQFNSSNINYNGFTFGMPKTDIKLGDRVLSMPGTFIGANPDKPIDEIAQPVSDLITHIKTSLGEIETAVKNSSAFDEVEKSALLTGIGNSIKSFESAMTTLMASIKQVFEEEQAANAALRNYNEANLSQSTNVSVE